MCWEFAKYSEKLYKFLGEMYGCYVVTSDDYNYLFRLYFEGWIDITQGVKNFSKNEGINIVKPKYRKELNELLQQMIYMIDERYKNFK